MAGTPSPEHWPAGRGASASPGDSPHQSAGALPLLEDPPHPPAAQGPALSGAPRTGGVGHASLPPLEQGTGPPILSSPGAREASEASAPRTAPTAAGGLPATPPGASARPMAPPAARAAARAPAQRHRTRAQPTGLILMVLAVLLLGWGAYALLASVHIVAYLLRGGPLFSQAAAVAIGAGALTALCAVICAAVAVVRARPRTMAVALLAGSLLLPAGAAATGLSLGASALKTQTLAEASAVAGQVDPAAVEALLARAQGLGIEVPWSSELLTILRQAERSAPDQEQADRDQETGG